MPSTTTTTKEDKDKEEAVANFYAKLKPKDRLIHELAAKMLKTRYSAEKSNAFVAEQRKNATA